MEQILQTVQYNIVLSPDYYGWLRWQEDGEVEEC